MIYRSINFSEKNSFHEKIIKTLQEPMVKDVKLMEIDEELTILKTSCIKENSEIWPFVWSFFNVLS